MEEVIKKIIEMVEAGKITAEDAERLIRAVKEAGKVERESEFFDLRWVPEMVKDTVKKSLKDVFLALHTTSKIKGEIFTEIPFKETVKVSSYAGDIKIKGWEREDIKIKAEDSSLEEKENELVINTKYKDIEILVPEKNPVSLILYSYSGEIEAEGNFKKLQINSYSGDVYVDAEFDEINIRTYNACCKLRTKRKPLTINLYTYGGEVEMPSGFKKERNTYIYGVGQYKKITFESYNGDFELKFKEE